VRTIGALIRKELGVYFVSPMAYIILTCLMLVFGLIFSSEAGDAADFGRPFSFGGLFWVTANLMVIVVPLVTMRLIAEEKNRGTIETLMTAPVTEFQVVLAKYVATLIFLLYLLLPTAAHAILVSKYGTLDVTETLTGYLGLFLISSSFLAIGLFVSSLCSSQVTAGVITLIVTFLLLLSSRFAPQITDRTPLGRTTRSVFEALDPFRYFGDFIRGIIDTRPLVYFLSLIVFFLFLSVRALEARRWR
jgi:ABC-2 type transport system permease protein